MTASIAIRIPDEATAYFGTVPASVVTELLASYRTKRERMESVASIFSGASGDVVRYFVAGNTDQNHRSGVTPEALFDLAGGLRSLNAEHWDKLLEATDVLSCMPQKRRTEWHDSIREMKTPDFLEADVLRTLADLLSSRYDFLGERVEGIFYNLSGEHVTNSPMGFRQRMILAYMTDSDGYPSVRRVGYINDLRCVIAKFMGRDEPSWNASTTIVRIARSRPGDWLIVDGGAIRLRVYKKGTAHIEIHEELAYRLNCILHSRHPNAIASEHRTRPARKSKDFVMIGRPLPFTVIAVLTDMMPGERHESAMTRCLPYGADKLAKKEARRVLESIGGVTRAASRNFIDFDYDPRQAIADIVASGCVPDVAAHQFYPTPKAVAEMAVELAEIGDEHTCLEPSAGQGGLADMLPKDRTVCVEISPLHCTILRAKGFAEVYQDDFTKWGVGETFDRIVMNPPFSEGRWQAHLDHAASMVAPGGRIVAILPASARGKSVLPGWSLTWTEPIDNEFAGTSISVVILVAERERG